MRLVTKGLALATGVSMVVGCGDSAGPDGLHFERFEWNGQVALDDRIEIKGISGNVTFTSSSGNTVQVEAEKTSHRDDVTAVSIEVVEHPAGVTICAMYPDVPGRPPNECVPGNLGNYTSEDSDVIVDFTVRVPPGRTLVATVVSGSLSAVGVQNEVLLTSVSGNIVIATSEVAEATAVSGNITASIGRDPERALRFATVSGNVTMTIPAACNAFVEMSAVSGSVASDFALDQITSRHLRGPVGTGGETLTIVSISGNVRLVRGS